MDTVNKEILKSIDLFNGLTTSELEKISLISELTKVVEGEEFMQRGKEASSFFIVLSGSYMVEFKNGQAFTLHSRGDILGWSSIISPHFYKGSGVALTDGELAEIKGSKFRKLIEEDTNFGKKIMTKLDKIVQERMPFVKGTE
ncbi:MAG: cyclic nucleotide-binding domain-containing protein [Desulfobacterales bacterium]|nr:cyclic nucleotide-binding domain-containing protein [Desulfobacterales bacterium]